MLDLAQSREKTFKFSDEINGLFHSMPYWDSRVAKKQYPDIKVDQFHIDIFAANLVRMPEFDVIVGSNLFGDILSDLGPACTGTIACTLSNINPEQFPIDV